MSRILLNDRNCKFMCAASPAVSFNISQLTSTFCDGSGNALTVNSSLSGIGTPCTILTSTAGGTPTPCSLVNCNSWIAGIEVNKRINGTMLLNNGAQMACPLGSLISAKILPSVNLEIAAGFESMKPKVAFESTDSLSTEIVQATPEHIVHKQSAATVVLPSQSVNQVVTAENVINNADDSVLDICKICDNSSECRYTYTPATIAVTGASLKLRRNSSIKEDEYNKYAERIMNARQLSWNNQAHHLISIKAAYSLNAYLVKLGNYFGYDINNEKNCCFLPCWESGDGYGQKSSHFKKAQAYEVMKASGLQWHVGQHDYSLADIPESVLQKYPQLRQMDCYNVLINSEINRVISECQKRFESICPADNYEKHREWFINTMNQLSEQIKISLDLFRVDPKRSYPYFVSLESLKYAFEIPRCGKVITIRQTNSAWVIRKYKFTNYLKDDEIELNPIGKAVTLAFAENRRNETIRKLIMYCENASCFLIIDENESFKLPFCTRVRAQYIRADESSAIKSHLSAMLAEQADSGEDEYISPKAMILLRLKECGLR